MKNRRNRDTGLTLKSFALAIGSFFGLVASLSALFLLLS